ncbi:MAG: CooT family nickel-binding protein [Dethiobacteraceae bacterium]|nr:CooT family nickel-binding protein [Bacillota bacterium]
MCEANAYLKKGDKEELFLESVDRIVPQNDYLEMENIFGVKKMIKAVIKEMSLVEHKIILEKVD